MSNAGGSANIGINLNTADLQAAIARIVAEANAAIQRVNANAPSISAGQLTIPNIPQGLDPAAQAAFVNALPGLLSRQISALGRQSGGLPSGANIQGFTGGAFGKSQIGDLLTSQLFGTTDLKAALGAVNSPLGQLTPQAIQGILNGPGLGRLSGSQIFNPTTLDARFSSLINSINTRLANFSTPGRQFIGGNDPNQLATDRVGQAQLEAAILEEIAKRKVLSDAYTEAVVSTKRQTAINEAEVQKQLAGDNAYIKAKQISAVALAKEAALIQQGLADSGAYLKAKSDLAIAQVQEQRNLANRLGGNQNLASSRQYVAEKTGLATAQARQEAAINQSLAGESAYISSKTSLATSQAQLATALAQSAAIDPAYRAAKADLVVAQELAAVALKSELLNGPSGAAYVQAKTANTVLLAQEKATLATALAGNRAYTQAKVEAAVAAKAQAAAEKQLLLNDPILNIRNRIAGAGNFNADARLKAQEAQDKLNSPTYIEDRGQEAADRERLRAQESVAKLRSIQGDDLLAAQKRQEVALKESIRFKELQSTTALDIQRKAQINIEQERLANAIKSTQLEVLTSAQGQSILREKARRLILEREYNQALQKELAAELRENGKPFAALTTRFGGGGFGGGASGGTGAAGFFGGGLLSTLKYSIPSALLFGAVAGLGSTIKEAEELNKTLSLLQGQLDATGRAGDFEGLRDGILSISRETGLAANNVAKFAVQLQGAFGRNIEIDGLSGTDLVKRQVEGVSKLDALLGLDDKQVIDTTVAVGRQFGVLAEQIGNVAFQAQQFGVPAEELQVFLADIAPVAKDAGFSLEEISTLGAASIINSGKGASSIAEAWGRVIPAVTKAKSELLEVSASNAALNNEQFRTAVAVGDVATIITSIGSNIDKLNGTSKDFVIQLLGGRREAQAILAAFSDPKLLEQLNFNKDDATAQDAAYSRLQATLGQTIKELTQVLQQLGLAILDAGVADALKLALELFKLIFSTVGDLVGAVSSVNEALGGWPVKIAATVAALKLLGPQVLAFSGITTATNVAPAAAGAAGAGGVSPGGIILPPGVNAGPAPAAGAAAGATAVNWRQAANVASVAVAAIAVSQVFATRDRWSQELQGQEDILSEQMKTASRAELEGISTQYNGFWDNVQSQLFNVDLPGVLAERELIDRDLTDNADLLAGFSSSNTYADRLSDLLREKYRTDSKELLDSLSTKEKEDVFDSQAIRDTIPNFDPAGGGLGSIDVNTVFDTDTLRAIIADAQAGDQASRKFVADLLNALPEGSDVRDLVQQLIEVGAPPEGFQEKLDETTLAFKEAELLYSSGRLDYESYRASLENLLAVQQQAFELSVAGGDPDAALLAKVVETENKAYQSVVERLKKDGEFAARFISIGGSNVEQAQVELDSALTALNDPELTNASDINDFVDSAIAAERALFEAQLDSYDTAAEKLAFLNSGAGELDPIVILKLIEGQLSIANDQWVELLTAYATFFDDAVGATLRSVVAAAIIGDATIEEVQSTLEQTILTLQLSGESRAAVELMEFSRKLEQTLAYGVLSDEEAVAYAFNAKPPENTSVQKEADRKKALDDQKKEAEQAAEDAKRQQEEAQRAAEEAQKAAIDLQNAQFEYYKILAGGDSLAVANISVDQARFALANATTPVEWQQATNQLAQAERERKEAEDAIVDARFSYAEVLAGDSAIGAAKIAQQRAAKAMQDAEGVAEELEALAQQFSADRAFELAIRSIFDAQANVVAAMAGYLDDSVASANVGLALAERQYQEALKDYNAGLDEGGEKLLGAQANLINAQATARDAELQGKLDELSVQFEFEKISKNQYIQYLKALKQMPDITKKQVLEIDRQIKQLSGELQQDLQFNLPTNLDLPTLYEVRRSIGSSSSGSLATNGGGYNDNRNVNVVINVNNDADRAFVTQVLEDNLGGPPRSGTSGRFY